MTLALQPLKVCATQLSLTLARLLQYNHSGVIGQACQPKEDILSVNLCQATMHVCLFCVHFFVSQVEPHWPIYAALKGLA